METRYVIFRIHVITLAQCLPNACRQKFKPSLGEAKLVFFRTGYQA